ncbi:MULTISPECIES: hypothetical protein [unclassified Duganella]|uniref:hypothetical protein n=1 Tax=unclassified Duganella TaxID=2636909 RepID=UPI00088ABBEE|nr:MULTISPECIES: hypothetical protein [unclassified Duganella]SDF79877.1 hypothetical protein SAMN05216320_1011358 [Duganella sp. OV458]SDI49264.1 hypothetical protein SAMN05428973_10157 [Duganella sp. OV510]
MSTVTHITAGRNSRLAVFAALAFAYQDSGLTESLMAGNLDAPESAPAGSHVSRYPIPGRDRNSVAPQLAAREFGLTYTVTVKDGDDKSRSYTAIGNPHALQDAAYDAGALGVFIRVRQ